TRGGPPLSTGASSANSGPAAFRSALFLAPLPMFWARHHALNSRGLVKLRGNQLRPNVADQCARYAGLSRLLRGPVRQEITTAEDPPILHRPAPKCGRSLRHGPAARSALHLTEVPIPALKAQTIIAACILLLLLMASRAKAGNPLNPPLSPLKGGFRLSPGRGKFIRRRP